MPKKPRFAVDFDPRLEPFLEEALEIPEIRKLLIAYHLKEDTKGIAKLAVRKFLEDMNLIPSFSLGKRSDNKTKR